MKILRNLTLTIIVTRLIIISSCTANPQPVEVVSVQGPLEPINPGGTVVEITLANTSTRAVTSLTATLKLNRDIIFEFDVSSSKSLAPGENISSILTLIGGAFDTDVYYPLQIEGTFENSSKFSFTKQVQITLPMTFAPAPYPIQGSYVSSFQDMDELCNSSDVIAVGTVKRVIEVVPDEASYGQLYDAKSAFRIDEVIKGEIGEEIVLTKLAMKDKNGWLEGSNVDPPFEAGEKWVLFLNAGEQYNNLGPWGRYKIIDDKVYSMNRIANDNNAYGGGQPDFKLDFNGVPLADFIASVNQTLDSVVLTFTDSRITWAIASAVRFNPGGFVEVNVNLSTGKYGPDNLTYSIKRVEGKESNIEVPIPEQMQISIDPAQLTAQPHNLYTSTLYIQTTDIPSGTYWIRVDYQLGKLISGYRVLMVNINP